MKNVQKQLPSIFIIIALVGFPQISEAIFTPVLPSLAKTFVITGQTSQLTMSSYFIGFAVGVPFWGRLSDRIGRRPAMLWGLTVYLAGNAGLLVAPAFAWLMIARLGQAFGAAAGSVVTQTIMRESFTGVRGARVFAQVSAAMALSPAFGPIIGGSLQTAFGTYRSVCAALIMMAIVLWFYVLLRLPETMPTDQPTRATTPGSQIIVRMLQTPRVWAYGLLISGINGVLFSYYAEAPFIFETHFGLSAIQYGWLGLVIATASIIGAVIANQLAGQVRPERIIDGGLGLALVESVAMLILAPHLLALLGTIFVTFCGINIALPVVLNRVLIGFEDVIGTASGLLGFGYYLLISLLTYLMSRMHNGSVGAFPRYTVLIVTAMTIISLSVHHWLARAK